MDRTAVEDMVKPRRTTFLAGLTIVVSCALTMVGDATFAFEVQPIRTVLTPAEGQTAFAINVTNTRPTPLPIEIEVDRRRVSTTGEQDFVPAGDAFVVFPPLALVPAGSSQAVRVQYVGDPILTEGEAYVVRVAEVPVSPPGFSGITVAYSFGVALYLQARGEAAPAVEFVARRQGDSVELTGRNGGINYVVLSHGTFEFSGPGGSVERAAEDFAGAFANPIIPPGASRVFDLPADGLPDGALIVSFQPDAGD